MLVLMHTATRRPSDFRKCLKGAAGVEAARAQVVEDIGETEELLLQLVGAQTRAPIVGAN